MSADLSVISPSFVNRAVEAMWEALRDMFTLPGKTWVLHQSPWLPCPLTATDECSKVKHDSLILSLTPNLCLTDEVLINRLPKNTKKTKNVQSVKSDKEIEQI